MRHTILATIMLVALSFSAEAYVFKSGDLRYNITSSTEPYTVEVTYDNSHNDYTNNYSSLTTTVIPETVENGGTVYSVTSIGSDAFANSGLTSLTIPNSVTSIGKEAFYGCSGLTSLTVPNSVTSIGEWAFRGCSGLTSLTIPNSVTSIGEDAFSDCYNLNYNEYDNALYLGNSDNPYLCQIKAKSTGIASCEINPNCRFIYSGAFRGCSGLTSLTIPNSVTSIGEEAFYGCYNLNYNEYDNALYLGNSDNPYLWLIEAKSADIASCEINPNCRFIYSGAFRGCSGLTSLTIPNSVTSIGKGAFSGCSGLTSLTIPNSVTSIGEGAFSGCSGLTSVTIPNSVTSIGSFAFYGCSGLTSLTIPNSVTSIGYNAFEGCSRLTSVTIPNSVTSISEEAFYGCSGLTSIAIPNSVTSIGNYAFEGCTSSVLYCQATEKPSGWANNWNYNGGSVVWGCKAVSLSANDNTFGAVTGGKDGLFLPNESITISATPAEHYHFAKWSDNSTENPRTITLTTDTTLIAVFAIDTFKVTASAENGTVSGAGLYAYGTQTSLTATPAEHYHFAKWSDGSAENPRSITITSDTTLTAVFAIDTLKVNTFAENGTVSGAGAYTYSTQTSLTATPAEHYHFAKWSDNSTENPRTITLTTDTTLIAVFAIDTFKVTASAENGTVSGAGLYAYGATTSLTATPAEHYHFAKWSDGNTENPRSIKVTSDTTLIAVFAIDTLKVTAFAENGTVSGAGLYAYGTQTSLTATPAKNFHFAKWSDGNTENPRSITVTEDITLIAIFEKADAISTDAVADVKIYAHHNVIVVENATDDIYVYDAMGRLIARNSDSNRNAVHHGSTEITMQNTGIYIVRTGDKSQRVAVSQN